MKNILFALSLLFVANLNAATKAEINTYRPYLIKWEGYRNKTYVCSTGNTCVGIGHLLLPKEKKLFSNYYSDAEINQFFTKDLDAALDACRRNIRGFDNLHSDAKLVAVSVSFNVGAPKFIKFKNFRLALEHKMYTLAAMELKDSKWYNQVQKSRALDHVNKLNNIK